MLFKSMKDKTSVVSEPLMTGAGLASAPLAGTQRTAPVLIPWILVIEAASEPAAQEHFRAILAGDRIEMFELSRGLLFSQAVQSGRYWKFTMQPPAGL